MKKTRFLGFPLFFLISLIIVAPFQGCDKDDDCDDDDEEIHYLKPNIYIYPNEQIELTVTINFPLGGRIDTSIPEYGTGWNVVVEPSGLINNKYSFLFYESMQPDASQKEYGWVVQSEKLETFFIENLTEYGFNEKEINDFIEYWIPLLAIVKVPLTFSFI